MPADNYARALSNLRERELFVVKRVCNTTGEIKYLKHDSGFELGHVGAFVFTSETATALFVSCNEKYGDIATYSRECVFGECYICKFQLQIDRMESAKPIYWNEFNVVQYLLHCTALLYKETLDNRKKPC